MENEHHDTVQKGGFLGLNPSMSFFFGIVCSIAIFSTVGFVFLLNGGSIGNGSGKVAGAADQGANGQADQAAAAKPSAPSAPAGATSLDLAKVENIRGKGDLTIVEFSDTECPFCKRFHATMQQVLSKYDGKVRWGYEHFPIESLHSKAPRESQATECAAQQGKFWEYIDKLIEQTPSNNGLADSALFTIADEVKLNRSKFDSCLSSEATRKKVDEDLALSATMGGQGTPFSVIVDKNGKVYDTISGALPVEQVSGVLDALLQ